MLFFSKIIVNFSVKAIISIKKFLTYLIKIISYPMNIIFKLLKMIIIKPMIQIYTKIKSFIRKNTSKLQNLKETNKKIENLQK